MIIQYGMDFMDDATGKIVATYEDYESFVLTNFGSSVNHIMQINPMAFADQFARFVGRTPARSIKQSAPMDTKEQMQTIADAVLGSKPVKAKLTQGPSGEFRRAFTGRFDANGQEVYDGDVLEDVTGRQFYVCFDSGAYNLYAKLYPHAMQTGLSTSNCKVVGHIWEPQV